MKNLSLLLSILLLSFVPYLSAQNTPELPASTPEAPASAPTGVVNTGIPDIIVIPVSPLPVADLQKAVVNAAINRNWIPTVTAENCVRCDITVRNKHRVVIDVIISSQQIIFRYVASENMDYNPNKKKKIHRKYEGWLKNLGVEINKEIAKINMQRTLQQ